MLEELKIKNFALIKDLSIKFTRGLNILTGETGAGKSIIIDALSAILGEKMTTRHIRSGEKKAVIEGSFLLEPNTMVEALLDNMGIEVEGRYLYIRRELVSDGRGRSFMNGNILPTSKLKEVGNLLVDIHGQNEHQAILKVHNHLLILDNFGIEKNLEKRRKTLSKIHENIIKFSEILANLELSSREKEEKKDYLIFSINEIKEAKLKPGEDEELAKEAKLLAGSEKLAEELHLVYNYFQGDEEQTGILANLDKTEKILSIARETDNDLQGSHSQVQEALYQLEDASSFIRLYLDSFDFSKERQEEVENRLDLISTLKKKYKAETVRQLLEYREKAGEELESINLSDKEINETKEKLNQSIQEYIKKGADLSNLRLEMATVLEGKMNEELKDLVMANTRFKINLRRTQDPESIIIINGQPLKFSKNGIDDIEFFISAGSEEVPRPLRKVASGGEMSRLMLALKKLIIDTAEPQSMIFDEVDAGIGGKVAERIGRKLKALSTKGQTICITHLPQIAALADIQFNVVKIVDDDKRVLTGIKRLTNKERVLEIARMMAGEQITDITIQHAKEMLNAESLDNIKIL